MLKSYEITNFKSFKNPTTIDLTTTSYELLTDRNTKDGILKGLLFVGANASGKSNAIIVVKLLLDLLFRNEGQNLFPYRCVFSSNNTIQLKYTFEVDASEIIYTLSFHFKKDSVDNIKEKLTLDGKNIIQRDGCYAELNLQNTIRDTNFPEDMLFLRSVYFNTRFQGVSALQNWFKQLSNSVYIDLYNKKISVYSPADLNLDEYLEKWGTDRINHFFKSYHFDQTIEYRSQPPMRHITFWTNDKMVFFQRDCINEPIPFKYESLGNQNLLRLLPAIFHCLDNNGILLIDEFSSGFHNDLERLLVRYFMQESKGAQLIFVSHSTNLLSMGLLRPDQIYTVDFDDDGSRLNRVSDENPRPSQNMEKMYLSGRFNGVPNYENHIE